MNIIDTSKTKEEKEIKDVIPEKCVVILTESGLIKRIKSENFKAQQRNAVGVKTKDDIVVDIIRTNTIDTLVFFTNTGRYYRLVVDKIPEGTNTTKGVPIKTLIDLQNDETVSTIYSIYRETEAKFITFITKKGKIKKVALQEFMGPARKNGANATKIDDNDALADVALLNNEDVLIITKNGYIIKIDSEQISQQGKLSVGIKAMNLSEDDEILTILPIRDIKDDLFLCTEKGMGKRIKLTDIPKTNRGTKGSNYYKSGIVAASLINNEDNILVFGKQKSLCIKGADISVTSKAASGVLIFKDNEITSISKV